MPTVTIIGTGESSDYRVSFSESLQRTEKLEIGEPLFITRDPPTFDGQIIDGEDVYVGEGDVTVKNLSKRIFGEAPDIIVEVNGQRERLSAKEEVIFEVTDGTDVPEPDNLLDVRIEGLGGFAEASDYRIISEGNIEKSGKLEFGDSISDGEAVGQVVRGVDEWRVEPPFDVINLFLDPTGRTPPILVFVEGEEFRLEPGEVLTFDSGEGTVEEDEERARERSGLLAFAANNPLLTLALGAGAVLVLKETTETAVKEAT